MSALYTCAWPHAATKGSDTAERGTYLAKHANSNHQHLLIRKF